MGKLDASGRESGGGGCLWKSLVVGSTTIFQKTHLIGSHSDMGAEERRCSAVGMGVISPFCILSTIAVFSLSGSSVVYTEASSTEASPTDGSTDENV